MTAEFYELLAVVCSSAGILGTVVSAVLVWMLTKAKKDAEEKRKERIAMELFRLEGEELLSTLVLASPWAADRDQGQAWIFTPMCSTRQAS